MDEDLRALSEWLERSGFESRPGSVTHTLLFDSAGDVERALQRLEKASEYRLSHRGDLESPDQVFVDVLHELETVSRTSVTHSLDDLQVVLRGVPFDYNNFAVLLDLGDDHNEFFLP